MQIYRRDLYEAKGLKPADTLDDYLENARALHDPSRRVWGAAMRGFAGVGQNVYIWAPIFRSFGGVWLVDGRVRVNSPEAVAALAWYVKALNTYAPHPARNWNWPDIADAFGQGLLGVYVDDLSSAAGLNQPMNSKVMGRIGLARCPKGPAGRRITSIFNWSFPVNAALAPRTKRATWLFISWAASSETQARTTWRFDGPVKRFGANRLSLWRSPDFARALSANGDGFVDVVRAALEEDRDIDARPRLPQWPDIGATMATAIRAALIGQESPRASLAAAQADIDRIMTR
jgi:ABC-type glycerol-3-phosphate transport system substrate-binding protein